MGTKLSGCYICFELDHLKSVFSIWTFLCWFLRFLRRQFQFDGVHNVDNADNNATHRQIGHSHVPSSQAVTSSHKPLLLRAKLSNSIIVTPAPLRRLISDQVCKSLDINNHLSVTSTFQKISSESSETKSYVGRSLGVVIESMVNGYENVGPNSLHFIVPYKVVYWVKLAGWWWWHYIMSAVLLPYWRSLGR